MKISFEDYTVGQGWLECNYEPHNLCPTGTLHIGKEPRAVSLDVLEEEFGFRRRKEKKAEDWTQEDLQKLHREIKHFFTYKLNIDSNDPNLDSIQVNISLKFKIIQNWF